MDYIIYNGELYHHGIPNMRWGVRRYQNKDGSLTPAGKKRYAKARSIVDELEPKAKSKADDAEESTTPKKKSVKDMSNDELETAIDRAKLEQRYLEYYPKHVSAGQKFVESIVLPALGKGVSTLINEYTTNMGKEFLGISQKSKPEPDAELKSKVDRLELEKRYRDASESKANAELKERVNKLDLEKRYEDHLKRLKEELEKKKEDKDKDK